MSGVGRLWTWLSKTRTRSTLAFIGGGIAAIVAAGWQVYVHFAPAPSQTRAEPQGQETAAPTAAPDVAAVGRLQASQKNALAAESDALDNVSQQIEAAGAPPKSAPVARH